MVGPDSGVAVVGGDGPVHRCARGIESGGYIAVRGAQPAKCEHHHSLLSFCGNREAAGGGVGEYVPLLPVAGPVRAEV